MQDFLTHLWREVFGELPPLADDRELLGRILVESLPTLPPYELGLKVDAEGPSAEVNPDAGPDHREDRAA